MNQINLQIFFDESGKKEPPTLMGALSIATNVYASKDYRNLNEQLKSEDLNLHWSEYSGNSKHRENIIRVIQMAMKNHRLLKFNAINYIKPSQYDAATFRKAFYTKLPERIIYGLLRGYGKGITVKTDIKIEYSNEYETAKLPHLIKDQLNFQALYRGEQFSVTYSQLVHKYQEIGIELTDLVLGIIRTIILNKPTTSKSKQECTKLVVELLQDDNFYSFLSKIMYFEWTGSSSLKAVSFDDYIHVFLSTHGIETQ